MTDLDDVNRSGFPLQLAVRDRVQRAHAQAWSVIYEEHAWEHDGDSGFLDLALVDRHHTLLLNLECKRVQNSAWLFLIDPNRPEYNRTNCKYFLTYRHPDRFRFFGTRDLSFHPESYESAYCVVPGQDPRARPMLERTAAELVESTRALAIEESIVFSRKSEFVRMYVNVIVTTASLRVATFQPELLELETGTLSDVEFQEVPFVRFRKQLSQFNSSEILDLEVRDADALVAEKESTVIVVAAPALDRFLDEATSGGNVESFLRSLR